MKDNKNLENTQTEENTTETAGQQEERTFTQEEVNEIVQKRLARERERAGAGTETTDKERLLEERELKVMAKEVLLNEGLPSSLADVLKFSDEKTLKEAIETIKNLEDKPQKAWAEKVTGMRSSRTDIFREAMGLNHK